MSYGGRNKPGYRSPPASETKKGRTPRVRGSTFGTNRFLATLPDCQVKQALTIEAPRSGLTSQLFDRPVGGDIGHVGYHARCRFR